MSFILNTKLSFCNENTLALRLLSSGGHVQWKANSENNAPKVKKSSYCCFHNTILHKLSNNFTNWKKLTVNIVEARLILDACKVLRITQVLTKVVSTFNLNLQSTLHCTVGDMHMMAHLTEGRLTSKITEVLVLGLPEKGDIRRICFYITNHCYQTAHIGGNSLHRGNTLRFI